MWRVKETMKTNTNKVRYQLVMFIYCTNKTFGIAGLLMTVFWHMHTGTHPCMRTHKRSQAHTYTHKCICMKTYALKYYDQILWWKQQNVIEKVTRSAPTATTELGYQ